MKYLNDGYPDKSHETVPNVILETPKSHQSKPPIKISNPVIVNLSRQVNHNETYAKPDFDVLESDIPQLDGQTAPFCLKCDNCQKFFQDKKQLEHHIDLHEYGCDDCNLCFTSKLNADLHELEKHPEDIDFYIHDHISLENQAIILLEIKTIVIL